MSEGELEALLEVVSALIDSKDRASEGNDRVVFTELKQEFIDEFITGECNES